MFTVQFVGEIDLCHVSFIRDKVGIAKQTDWVAFLVIKTEKWVSWGKRTQAGLYFLGCIIMPAYGMQLQTEKELRLCSCMQLAFYFLNCHIIELPL